MKILSSTSMNEEYKRAYKWLVAIVVSILCFAVPIFLFTPFLFHNVSFSTLSTAAKVGSSISFIIGLWLAIVAIHLRFKEKRLAVTLMDGSGTELGMISILYILFKGTKSIITSIRRKTDE